MITRAHAMASAFARAPIGSTDLWRHGHAYAFSPRLHWTSYWVTGQNQVPQRRVRFARNDNRRVALDSTSLSSEFGDLTRCGRGERARQSRNSRIGGEKTVKNRAESLWKVRFLGHPGKNTTPRKLFTDHARANDRGQSSPSEALASFPGRFRRARRL